jgi:hypothetical protein
MGRQRGQVVGVVVHVVAVAGLRGAPVPAPVMDPSITETSHLTVDFGISEPLAPPIATAASAPNPWHRQSGKAGAGSRDRTETAMGLGSPNCSGSKTRS